MFQHELSQQMRRSVPVQRVTGCGPPVQRVTGCGPPVLSSESPPVSSIIGVVVYHRDPHLAEHEKPIRYPQVSVPALEHDHLGTIHAKYSKAAAKPRFRSRIYSLGNSYWSIICSSART